MAVNSIYHNLYLQMGVVALLGASRLNWACDYGFSQCRDPVKIVPEPLGKSQWIIPCQQGGTLHCVCACVRGGTSAELSCTFMM